MTERTKQMYLANTFTTPNQSGQSARKKSFNKRDGKFEGKSGYGSDEERSSRTDVDESLCMQPIRDSIIENSSFKNHKLMAKKSHSAEMLKDLSPCDYDDPHWPEIYMDSLDKPVQKGDQSDVITPDDVACSFKFSEMSQEEVWKLIKCFKFFANHEDVRFPFAYKKGGKLPEKDIVMKKIRNLAKEVLMNLGKKILSGNFNLTTVSFPIKAMVPKSYLENIALGTCYYPLYMNLAAQSKDPLQRLKYYIVGSFCYYFLTNSFAKPLNPIIGETMHGHYNDGTNVFLEQTSHHPPISYILVYGPNNSYKSYGPAIFSASAGLNSLTLVVKGWRKVHFKNPDQEIHNTFPNETYDGTFWGTCVHETLGVMDFTDKKNNLSAQVRFGKAKGKPSDYIEGEIKVNGAVVSKITGTYLGWIDIDGQRYFDYRYLPPFKFFIERSRLGSDFAYRPDLYFLQLGDIPKAQKEKENLEQVQRTDAKLRKAHAEKMKKK